jgi:hypothetical protein
MLWVKGALRRAGVDRPVAFAVAARLVYVLSAPVTLLLIQRALSPEAQGYFFTFASLLALTTVFELGLSQVLLFTASHEQGGLWWAPDGTLDGEADARGRVASLTRSALRWYAAVAGFVLVVLVPSGFLFFSRAGAARDAVAWQGPWTLAVAAAAGACLLSPVFAVLEGCGLVAEVQLARLVQQLAGTAALWAGLLGGAELYAVPLNLGASLALGVAWIVVWRGRSVREIVSFRGGAARVHWRTEVWPMQWRMALSWIAGWFVFQVFSPMVFAYQGAVAAGRIGLTLTLSHALVSVGSAWTNPKAALFGHLAARRDYGAMDAKYREVLRQSVALVAAGGVAVVLGVVVARAIGHPMAERLLAPWPTAALMGVAVANQIVFAQTVYLRAHREEPLLGVTLALGAAVAVTSWLLARSATVDAVAFGYFALTTVIFLGGGTIVFRAKRREWQGRGSAA